MVLVVAERSDSEAEGQEEEHGLPGDKPDGERRTFDPPPVAGYDSQNRSKGEGATRRHDGKEQCPQREMVQRRRGHQDSGPGKTRAWRH